ncbi:hypothetical protein BDW74DRAFT_161960 [Aspergillus multicolor]|uniref:VOC family protein n=1 Tax=Aspergillus multicolor TaxID=41759 RepID=UPI003CCCECE9
MEFDPDELIPSSRIDHVGITAPSDAFEPLIQFYLKALAPLHYKEIMRFPGAVGLGNQVPDFWISEAKTDAPQGLHFAFGADDRKAVDAFHEAAIQAGGKCNGKPGLRTEYHPNYYAAFIIDPRGNNVEIVCHLPVKE